MTHCFEICTVLGNELVTFEGNIEVDQDATIAFLCVRWTVKDIVWGDVAMDDILRE